MAGLSAKCRSTSCGSTTGRCTRRRSLENIQRADLNPIEKAHGFKDYLTRYGVTTEQLGVKLGIDRTSACSNLVGLLNLPADVQDAVRHGQVSLGHAKILEGARPTPEEAVRRSPRQVMP